MQKESVVVPSHKWSSVLKRESECVCMWERVREGGYPRMGACECARVWVHVRVREREGAREQARVASMFINNLLHHWLSYSFIHPLTSGEFEAAETEKEKRLLLQYFMKKICSVFSGKRNWNPQGEILKNGQVIEAHQQNFRKLHWSKKEKEVMMCRLVDSLPRGQKFNPSISVTACSEIIRLTVAHQKLLAFIQLH